MKQVFAYTALVLSLAGCKASYTDVNNPSRATLSPNAANTSGTLLNKLGQRSIKCVSPNDKKALVFPNSQRDQIIDLLKKDNLKNFTFTKNYDCLRVGNEVTLEFDQGVKKFFGRAFVTSMDTANNHFKVNFDTINRVYTTQTMTADERLPSCRSRGDWSRFIIGEENVDEKMEALSNGSFRAQITNGALSCYRIGHASYVKTHRKDKERRGEIIAEELHLLHISELTQTHADLVNMTLAELLQSLDAEKDRDGGFVNIIVFIYTPPEKEEQ